MAPYHPATPQNPLGNPKRWVRFVLEAVVVVGLLLALVAYFANSPSPEIQRAGLLEAIRLTLAEPPHKDTKKALSIALELADKGSRDAQVLAGLLFLLNEDKLKANEQLRKADAAGSLYACRLMASESEQSTLKAANCGNPFAQNLFGYTRIQRDKPDYVSGVAYLEAGVANGDPFAHSELGRLLGFDEHVTKDLARAKTLLQFALEHGQSEAGFALWTLSLAQRTGPRNSKLPQSSDDISSCYKAAELGDANCQGVVAAAYLIGVGLPQDDVAAYMWFNLAASNAGADAEERRRSSNAREFIRSNLSAAQLAEAQRLTREWKPKKVELPKEQPLAIAMRQVRDEMDGKFPAVPNLKLLTAPAQAPATAALGPAAGGGSTNLDALAREVYDAPAAAGTKMLPGASALIEPDRSPRYPAATPPKTVATPPPGPAGGNFWESSRLVGDDAPSPAAAGAKALPGASAVAPGPLAPQDALRPAPSIARMEPVERRQTMPATSIEFVSQSLCGTLVKDRAALSAQTGGIQGCKKRQVGGRSDIAVDNTANDTAVLVKLYPSGVTQSAAVRVFTIPAYGSWTESGIRAGTYELRYEDLATKAFTKTEPLTLNEVQIEGGVKFSHLKVTLYKVKNGNMKTQPIAKGEFDD